MDLNLCLLGNHEKCFQMASGRLALVVEGDGWWLEAGAKSEGPKEREREREGEIYLFFSIVAQKIIFAFHMSYFSFKIWDK